MAPRSPTEVLTPEDATLTQLCETLARGAERWRTPADWPREALATCAEAGVFRWFLPVADGGLGWSEADQTRGYLRLAAADLTTTFIITQFIGACRRIAGSDNPEPARRWLARLLTGDAFGTVGISHLTTSRRHLQTPVLRVSDDPCGEGFRLTGVAPWVTGAIHADVIVLAGTLEDGRELLAAVPTDHPAMRRGAGVELVALSASCTDQVELDDYPVAPQMVIAGPRVDVMRAGVGAGTGGLQTSTLAIGLARAAVEYLTQEGVRRQELAPVAQRLAAEVEELEGRLVTAATQGVCDANAIRGGANRLVMRTTQAAMTAAKGAGFVQGHPVGRWCREALFFLVWSCPQPVATEQLCELAGIDTKNPPEHLA